jgi:fructosamine-3-kinase
LDTQVSIGKDSIDKDSIGNNIQRKNAELTAEFEEVWRLYPNKQGKERARNCYIKARKEGILRDDIENGVKKYAEHCKAKKIEPKYIKHGDTWFANKSWQDDYDQTVSPTAARYGNFDPYEAFERALQRSRNNDE